MNSVIDLLNTWGERTLDFAWPMLWQSSLLIAVIFALDMALRQRVRAAVRYALWMVVLMKLVTPPTFASPTSLAWWLRPTPPLKPAVQSKHFVVTYSDTPATVELPMTLPPLPVPRPKLSLAGWFFVTSATISLGLMMWITMRWRTIARTVKSSPQPSVYLHGLLLEARNSLMMKWSVKLQVTSQPMSPAIFGFFRPMILLSHAFTENLSRTQLRSVLLHELIHLRRGDVWVNCLQALLQTVYWWHPLLWLANARIRRVREEAVDDAVMLTLQEDAPSYAPTLLQVAKLAFSRPMASLGLVGILESRSALRQRVERLVNFRPPREAGLTFISVLGVIAFAALAAPMSQSPQSSDSSVGPSNSTDDETSNLTVIVDSEVFIRNIKARAAEMLRPSSEHYSEILVDILRSEGVSPIHPIRFDTRTGQVSTQNTSENLRVFEEVVRELNLPGGERIRLPHDRKQVLIQAEFYKLKSQQFDQLELNKPGGPQRHGSSAWLLPSERLAEMRQRIASLGIQPLSRPRILTARGIAATLFVGDATNNLQFECLPFVIDDGLEIAVVAHTAGWFGNNPPGDWPTFEGRTNCAISQRVPVSNNGGVILRAENASGQPENNLVLLLDAKLATAATLASSEHSKDGPKKPTESVSAKLPGGLLVFDEETRTTNVPPGELQASFVFNVTNVSESDVTITGVVTSCGCTVAKLPASPWLLSPGANGQIPVVMDLKGKSGSVTKTITLNSDKGNKTLTITARIPPMLVQDARLLYEMGKLDEAEAKLNQALKADPDDKAARFYLELIKEAKEHRQPGKLKKGFLVPNVTRNSDGRREIVSKLSQIQFDSVSYDHLPLGEVVYSLTEETKKRDPDRKGINFILNPNSERIGIDPMTGLPTNSTTSLFDIGSVKISINPEMTEVPLGEVLDAIVKTADRPIKYSIEDSAIVFSASSPNPAEMLYTRTFKLDPKTFERALQERAGLTKPDDPTDRTSSIRALFASVGVDLQPPKSIFYGDRKGTLLVRASLADLEAVERLILSINEPLAAKTAGTETSAAAREAAPAGPGPASTTPEDASSNLQTRTFKVDPRTFLANLRKASNRDPGRGEELQQVVREVFAKYGVDSTPPGTVFFNDNNGLLLVRGTVENLAAVESTLQALNTAPLQVNIEAKFAEVPDDIAETFNAVFSPEARAAYSWTGILSGEQARKLLDQWKEQKGVEILAAPQVITLSGRQAQIQIGNVIPIVTGLNTSTNGQPQTTNMLFGPVLDVTPAASADSNTISLTVKASVTEFLGYDDPGDVTTDPPIGNPAFPLPHFRVREMSTSAVVWDGQTLVLGRFSDRSVTRKPNGREESRVFNDEKKKHLFVFVTPTLIDSVGNRVHTDENLAAPQVTTLSGRQAQIQIGSVAHNSILTQPR